MQKFKHTASKYAVVSALALFIMIFLWFFFNWSYVNFKGDILFNYSNKDKLTEFFTDNFYGTRACCLVFPLPFAFAINYLLYDEKVFYICRIKNRMQYITQCVKYNCFFIYLCLFSRGSQHNMFLPAFWRRIDKRTSHNKILLIKFYYNFFIFCQSRRGISFDKIVYQ